MIPYLPWFECFIRKGSLDSRIRKNISQDIPYFYSRIKGIKLEEEGKDKEKSIGRHGHGQGGQG